MPAKSSDIEGCDWKIIPHSIALPKFIMLINNWHLLMKHKSCKSTLRKFIESRQEAFDKTKNK